MKALLVVPSCDCIREPNQRAHHLIHHIAQEVSECTVFYPYKVIEETGWKRIKRFLLFSVSPQQRGNVRYFAVNPPLNHPDGSALRALNAPDLTALKQHPVKRFLFWFLYLVGGILSDLFLFLSLLAAIVWKDKRKYGAGIFQGPFSAMVGLILRRLRRIDILVYEDIDFVAGQRPHVVRRAYTGWLERVGMKKADVIISSSISLAEMRERQVGKEVHVIYNGANISLFRTAVEKRQHPPTLLYMGNVYDRAGLEVVIAGLPLVRREIPSIRLMVVGTSTPLYREKLDALIERSGVSEHVFFYGRKSQEELVEFLKEADIGLAFFTPCMVNKLACSLKVLEYLAAGVFVVGTKETETESIICRCGYGRAVDYTVEAFASAVLDYYADREKYDSLRPEALSFSSQFSWGNLIKDEYDLIRNASQALRKRRNTETWAETARGG